ncbi:MAG: hypothetical protein NG747_07370 [Candidatus Brocadia sp.]|nr:hypothetical protein [Candidatus Brocadia sp.]
MLMFTPKHKAFFVLLLVFSAFLPVSFVTYAGESEYAVRTTNESRLFNITIQGTVSGWSFTRTGILVLSPTVTDATTNDINFVEVVISSGDPIIHPERGAIQFATNNYFLWGIDPFDVVNMSKSGNCITVNPDLDYKDLNLNYFNVSSGLFAIPYQIYSGTIEGCVDKKSKTVSGHINVIGKTSMSGESASYVANFEGQYIGKGNFDNLMSMPETDGFMNVFVTLKLDVSFDNNSRKSFYRREIRKLQNAVLEKLNPDDVVATKRLTYAPTMLLRINENALQELITFPEVSDVTTISSAFRMPQ